MRGNILTQTSWKVKTVFTLTVLFGTTCLFLTNLPAGYVEGDNIDREGSWTFAGSAYGEAYVTTAYDAPTAWSCHNAYIWNGSNVQIRRYHIFTARVTVPPNVQKLADKEVDDEGWVDGGSSWSACKRFSFNMTRKPDGRYTIHGSSSVTAKIDWDGEGFDDEKTWNASTSTGFKL